MKSSAPTTLRLPAAAPTDSSAAAQPRLPGLDWLRAFAAVAVVALHAGIPYMTRPLPALEWCVRSTERSPLVDALCWAINIAVMPTFFLMGGALAAGIWNRRPGREFVAHRTRRLLLPLAFAILVVLPADMYVWLIGWYTQGLIPWQKVLSLKLASPLREQFWGVAHLWYLECLWALSLIAAVIQWGGARWRSNRAQRVPHPGPLPQPSFAAWNARRGRGRIWTGSWQLPGILVAGVLLALDPTFLIGFQQTWWPGPAAIAFYGVFFAAGWRQGERLRRADRQSRRTGVILLGSAPAPGTQYSVLGIPYSAVRTMMGETADRSWRSRLLFAAGLFAVLLPQIHRHVETPLGGLDLLALAIAYAACSWLTATGLFSLAISFTAKSVPAPVAFLAEASFWMYLVHHPLVGLTQLSLLGSSVAPGLKFTASVLIGVGLSIASYGVLVRGTWIGRLLNGHGLTHPAREAAVELPTIDEPVRRAA